MQVMVIFVTGAVVAGFCLASRSAAALSDAAFSFAAIAASRSGGQMAAIGKLVNFPQYSILASTVLSAKF